MTTSKETNDKSKLDIELDNILFEAIESAASYTHKVTAEEADYIQEQAKQSIKSLFQEIVEECIGEMEYRNTEDMSLSTWSAEDLKAFGRNELRNEIMNDLEKRLK